MASIKPYDVSTLVEGQTFDFGSESLTKAEIIDFGKTFDPLYFHVDEEAAKKSLFGELVASGPQLFIFRHRKYWIPMFGHSVLAGMEIERWRFYAPVRPDEVIDCQATVLAIHSSDKPGVSIIDWKYVFESAGNTVCTLKMKIMHHVARKL